MKQIKCSPNPQSTYDSIDFPARYELLKAELTKPGFETYQYPFHMKCWFEPTVLKIEYSHLRHTPFIHAVANFSIIGVCATIDD